MFFLQKGEIQIISSRISFYTGDTIQFHTCALFYKFFKHMTASCSSYLDHPKPHAGLSYARFCNLGATKNNHVIRLIYLRNRALAR